MPDFKKPYLASIVILLFLIRLGKKLFVYKLNVRCAGLVEQMRVQLLA